MLVLTYYPSIAQSIYRLAPNRCNTLSDTLICKPINVYRQVLTTDSLLRQQIKDLKYRHEAVTLQNAILKGVNNDLETELKKVNSRAIYKRKSFYIGIGTGIVGSAILILL